MARRAPKNMELQCCIHRLASNSLLTSRSAESSTECGRFPAPTVTSSRSVASAKCSGTTRPDLPRGTSPTIMVRLKTSSASSAAALAPVSGVDGSPRCQAFTKWVPHPGAMTRELVERAIDISRKRMGVDSFDLLQFHWWDYEDERYLTALGHLADLQREGQIKHLALTNFDTQHLKTMR